MTKTVLANGMSLVEMPEAGLSVLCGCPENAVKFLKKSGQVREIRRDGVAFETGPNAILLSELPVQGGRFRNLGEFPVLQMLYRQGMIIPGHPNNTGIRPMIIGMRDQVEAQSRYIYSGNYGLSTIEELEGAGLGRDRAAELLRMKLWFAFGSIKRTEELLDLRIFDGHAIELRGGAFVRRMGANRYEFLHAGQTARVDLDPGHPGQAGRELPYELPRRAISRDYFSVVHIGEGDGWDPDRPCMASLVCFRGDFYLVDAGPDIEASLEAVGLGIGDLKGIFHTHAHDDHFVGLTALLRADRRLAYYAVPWVRASVEAKLRALTGIGEREFRRYFDVRDLEGDRWNDLDGLEVLPIMSPHPVETTAFRFRARGEGGLRSYAHLADLASFAVLDSMVVEDRSLPGISAELAARTKSAYLESADVKKVDVGGGMIHGSAADFAADESGRILLSHTSAPVAVPAGGRTTVALFGEADVLIAGGGGFPTAALERYDGGEPYAAIAPRSAFEGISAIMERTPPFSEMARAGEDSRAALERIAARAWSESVPEGRGLIEGEKAALCLIVRGRARVMSGGRIVGSLGPGDVFGEEGMLIEGCCLFDATTLEPLEMYRVPYEAIEERPILLWRLREKLESRLSAVKSVFDFSWRQSYAVGEPAIDAQHVKLFDLIGSLDAAVWSPESCPDATSLVAELADFAELHFATEEGFMRRGSYPELAAHSREHESLLRDVAAYRERIDCGDPEAIEDLDSFLKDWALKHTLLIDRQYIPYLPVALASRSPLQ
jgi:hemerythrin-like metal-binding protein